MTRKEMAVDKHKQGYNCAQAVLCTFADKTNLSEDELFRISEAFGGGMGGTQGVCGAVSAMVFLAGLEKSSGIDSLPQTNKMESYTLGRELMEAFEGKNQSIICSRLKGEGLRSCDGCIEDAVEIIEENLF
ncbi:MAG: C_GCAxxG_C_C family protein [Ruminococcaceae bacterium]|nr:C_GCAxxG_C_C family protein [Oscillospiraceae bacterium]